MSQRYHRAMMVLFVFISLPLLFLGPLARAGEVPAAETTPCNCDAYVIDTDPKGLNVRTGPGGDYSVIQTLPTDTDVEVTITGSLGSWMKIESAYVFAEDGRTEDADLKITGWVWGPLLGVRTNSPSGKPVSLYSEPDAASRAVTRLPMETETSLTGCRGGWVRVTHGSVEGWLDPASHCGNPVTTCP